MTAQYRYRFVTINSQEYFTLIKDGWEIVEWDVKNKVATLRKAK